MFGQKSCILVKVDVVGQICCIRAKWLYLGKMVVFGQNGSNCANLLYSGKLVVIGQRGCIWAK